MCCKGYVLMEEIGDFLCFFVVVVGMVLYKFWLKFDLVLVIVFVFFLILEYRELFLVFCFIG